MKLTNKYGLPGALVAFAKRNTYNAGKSDITVTSLIDSPRVKGLQKSHADSLEEDVSDVVWRLTGTAIHHILEQYEVAEHIPEERLFVHMAGWDVSGQIDSQVIEPDGVTIWDYKFTSAYAVMANKQDWHNQLNMYAFLARKAKGVHVKALKICAFIRDWSQYKTSTDGYPPASVSVLDIPVWDADVAEAYVNERLSIHAEADATMTLGGTLARCSDAEQWRGPPSYAVMREKNLAGRAWRVFDKEAEATEFCLNNKGGVVQLRPSESVRCKGNYCKVAAFCDQWKSEGGSNE